tara:strand:- start:315 stop:611 length:297 start_codon:yes stop_codon:yes gene_type:complete
MDNTHRKIPKTWMIETLPLIDMLVRIAKIESKNLDTNGFTVDEWAVQALLDAAAEIEEDIGFTTTSLVLLNKEKDMPDEVEEELWDNLDKIERKEIEL